MCISKVLKEQRDHEHLYEIEQRLILLGKRISSIARNTAHRWAGTRKTYCLSTFF